MYVCVCHAVTEGDVRDKVAAGATTPKAVRAACGMRPGCGACVRRIRALLDAGDAGRAELAERAAGRLDLGGVEHAPAA
jgi:bacterioferritin-associated ferredoxin